MKRSLVLIAIVFALLPSGCGTSKETSEMPEIQNEQLKRLSDEPIPIEDLEAFIEQTMAKANVAGLSCAIINDNEVVYRRTFGYKDQRDSFFCRIPQQAGLCVLDDVAGGGRRNRP
jgi:CubicO group peptidase (beta-lactamase class C family)